MPLDNSQQSKATTWLQRHNPRCPVCGGNGFSLGEIVAPPVMQGGGINIGGPSVPVLQVVCGNCAHVLHFAAVPMGLP